MRKGFWLRSGFSVAVVLVATAASSQEAKRDPYVGNQMCVRCHAVPADHLTTGPHRSENLGSQVQLGCQTCHGPGRAHVQEPDNVALQPLVSRVSTADLRTACASCHGRMPEHDTAHAAADVSCASCHTVHHFERGVTGEAGEGACVDCHTTSTSYGEQHDAAGLSCSDCHGLESLEDGVPLGPQSACFDCHGGVDDFDTLHEYDRAALETLALTCDSCHGSVHDGGEDRAMTSGGGGAVTARSSHD